MFWQAASFGRPSAIEGILDREDFSLEDLLQEDDLVQEVKAANQRLLAFLLREAELARLLGLMLSPPAEGADEERALKLRLGACEVLCSGSEEVADAVLAHPAFLPRLFAAAAEGEAPPDATAASCFVRVAGQLLAQRGDGLLAWLQEHADVLEGMTDRLATAGVPETLQRIVGADDSGPPPAPPAAMAWLTDTRLLSLLLTRLEAGGGAAAEGAGEVLTAVARAQRSPLTAQLAQYPNLARLVARISGDAGDAALVQALNICIALVERRRQWEAAAEAGAAAPITDADRGIEAAAVQALAEPAAALLGRLGQAQTQRRQETPFGLLAPPLGTARLTAVVLLAVLIRTGLPAAERALTQAGLVRRCLDLLLAYPFNSILHHQVASMVAGILECGSDALLEHLLDGCQLLGWLTGAPLEVAPVPLRKPPKAPLRAGYSGHLTLIGNKLLEAAEERPLLAAHLDSHAAWQEFAAGRLAEANRVEDVGAWECGRPAATLLAAGDSDDDFGAYGGAKGSGFAGLVEAASDSDSDSDEELSPGGQAAFEASAAVLEADGLSGLRDRLWDDDGDGSDDASPTGGSPGLGGGDLSLAHSPQRPGSWGASPQPASASYLAEITGSPDVPSSWEDLALDAAGDLPPHRLTPRPPPAEPPAEPPAAPPGPRVVGFAAPAAPGPPGSRPAGSPPPSSALSERLRSGGGGDPGGGGKEVEAAEAAAVKRLLQASAREPPPATAAAKSSPSGTKGPAEAEQRPGRPWLARGGSADLDAHPLSGSSSMDSDDASAELSASVAAELEQLDLSPEAGPRENGTTAGHGAAEHEEQTLVGSFTKLEPGSSQSPPAAAAPPSH